MTQSKWLASKMKSRNTNKYHLDYLLCFSARPKEFVRFQYATAAHVDGQINLKNINNYNVYNKLTQFIN